MAIGCTAAGPTTGGAGCVAGIGAGVVAFGSGLKAINDANKEFNG